MTPQTPLAGRWDDSYKEYRVLYTSDSAEGALRETLQRFVPSRTLLERLAAVKIEPEEEAMAPLNTIPISWLQTRRLGEIAVVESCDLVDVLHTQSLDIFLEVFEHHVTVAELLGPDTSVTRQISRFVYNRAEEYAGLRALSKLGSNIVNYNFFEAEPRSGVLRARLRCTDVAQLKPSLPALADVVNQLGLIFEALWSEVSSDWVLPTPSPVIDPGA